MRLYGRAPAWYLWSLAALVFLLDAWSKAWALRSLPRDHSIEILGDFFRLSYVRNTGVAFGLFADRGLSLGWVSLVALVLVMALAFRASARRWGRATSLGLILGGALGNLVDRMRWGSVVDFFDVGVGQVRWPVFNVADASISIGVALWAAQLLFARPTPEEMTEASIEQGPEAQAVPAAPQPVEERIPRDDARGA